MRERFEMLSSLDEFVGTYISNEWVRKNVLRFSDEDIDQIKQQIDKEKATGDDQMPDPDDPRFG